MKVVLDTNVLISAFVFKGFSAKVFDHCATAHTILVSPWIVNELEEKLTQKFSVELFDVESIIHLLLDVSEIVEPDNDIPTICRDEDDNNILQLAEFAQADFIVTGDKDLLLLETFINIPIITPRDFANQFGVK